MADAGAHVVLAARTATEIAEAANAIRARGQQADPLTLDVRDVEAVKTTIAAREPFDILVNNAGTNRPAPFVDVKVEDFDFVFGLNVRAAYFLAQAVARRLIDAKKSGSIINMSSQMGHVGGPTRTVYCATKHAMEGFTKAMAIELAPYKIRVNTAGADLHRDADDAAILPKRGVSHGHAQPHQARPPRPARGPYRRYRVPGERRRCADDRHFAGRRRRLDGGMRHFVHTKAPASLRRSWAEIRARGPQAGRDLPRCRAGGPAKGRPDSRVRRELARTEILLKSFDGDFEVDVGGVHVPQELDPWLGRDGACAHRHRLDPCSR
jgi:NAD(P)-dependent dehydrogenase (short-subunit alcohol dehydrogenase family)